MTEFAELLLMCLIVGIVFGHLLDKMFPIKKQKESKKSELTELSIQGMCKILCGQYKYKSFEFGKLQEVVFYTGTVDVKIDTKVEIILKGVTYSENNNKHKEEIIRLEYDLVLLNCNSIEQFAKIVYPQFKEHFYLKTEYFCT